MIDPDLGITLLVGLAACVYASVGHGGASAYLAILALTAMTPQSISAAALMLNLVVATIAFVAFRQAKCLDWGLTWPFLVGCVPAAYAGSKLPVSDRIYFMLVAAAILWAGVRMLFSPAARPRALRSPGAWVSIAVGVVLGFVAGVIGVGGGIFLSPLLILMRWATPRTAAATSAVFIIANSAIGLLGRSSAGLPELPATGFLVAAASGALLGGWWGSHRATMPWLNRSLGIVLIGAAVKIALRG